MKNLVFGALVLAAASTGCVITSNDPPPASYPAVVTANWSFKHFADGSARSCPVGYGKATIVSQPWDPIANQTYGTQIQDNFFCNDLHGTTGTLDGIYLVWVQITDESGRNVYAKSAQSYIDTRDGNASITLPILDDAGYMFLTWDIVRERTNAPLTCADVGTGAKVETTATLASGGQATVDNWPCNHYFGTTDPLLTGTYTVSIDATLNNQGVGTSSVKLTNVQITSPNGLTDLGHVLIPIP